MNKVAVITGGSKGIGRAIAERFCKEGFDIITCSRNRDELNKMAIELKEQFPSAMVHVFKADLSKKDEVDLFSEFILSKSESIDVLVNNTGTFIPGQIHSEEEGALETMISTNLYSAYWLSRNLIPAMKERSKGHIFNICSIASFMAYANGGSYAISKFAMYGMSKCLREELKEYLIRVTSILPGATYTASWEGIDLPPERFIKSEDVAETVWSAFSISQNSVVEEVVIRPQLGDI
ncbi:MAG: SDR family oxidoreductase [Bacteroidota bacterium]